MSNNIQYPEVVNKRYVIRIHFPWSDWLRVYGESHTDSLSYAKRAFDNWCDKIEAAGQYALISLVEPHVGVHRVVMVSPPNPRIELPLPVKEPETA